MTFIQSIILGIVQGITEFLPISSSAHLVLVPYLLNWDIPQEQLFPFDVLVQLGTLIAIIFYYREDLIVIIRAMIKGILARKPFEQLEARTGWLTLLATIPAGFVGLLLKPVVKSTFDNPAVTSVFLFITAALLVASEVIDKNEKEIEDITWKDALWIGAFQLLSVFPGISRSGSTITGGMIRNLKRRTAGQFAFLMAIPIMLAAGLVGIIDLFQIPNVNHFLPVMATGFIIAAIVGYFAISWLIGYINNHSLVPFAGYCLLMGAGSLALFIFNPQIVSNGASLNSTSDSYQSAYTVGIDPDQEWLIPIMNNCQKEISDLNMMYQQYANSDDALVLFDAYFTYDQPQAAAENTYELGKEELFVVVNPTQPVQLITTDAINGVFSGRITTWQTLSEFCADCFPGGSAISSNAINVWVLAEDSHLWAKFDALYLENPLSSFANIAPNLKAMRQSINSDSNAIGILTSGWLDDSIKTVDIVDKNGADESLSITVTTRKKPDDDLSQWLNCIQTALNP